MKPTPELLKQGDILHINNHPHHEDAAEFIYIGYCEIRSKAIFWKGMSALYFFTGNELLSYTAKWLRTVKGQEIDLLEHEVCEHCNGTGQFAHSFTTLRECGYCNGLGFIKSKPALEPKWTLDNPVHKLMDDMVCKENKDPYGCNTKSKLEVLTLLRHRSMYILATMWGLKEALNCSDESFAVDWIHGKWSTTEYRYGLLPKFSYTACEKVADYLNEHFPTGYQIERTQTEDTQK